MADNTSNKMKIKNMSESAVAFVPAPHDAVKKLESITAAEKAQAVPYVKIWEIKSSDGSIGNAHHPMKGDPLKPVSPLSLIVFTPSKFGQEVEEDVRFMERPAVSLERLLVKTQNPRGSILFRTVELSFVVHRPEILYERHVNKDGSHLGSGDSWSSLITPGEAFCLEYGWRCNNSVKVDKEANGILTGEGMEFEAKFRYADDEEQQRVVVDGIQKLYFIVTNYKFTMQQDCQIKFNIQGYELSSDRLRNTSILKNDSAELYFTKEVERGTPPAQANEGKKQIKAKEKEPYSEDRKMLNSLIRKFKQHVKNKYKDNKTAKVKTISFGDLFEVIFADAILEAFKDAGMEIKALYIGKFNDSAGCPFEKYSENKNVSGKNISEFMIPVDDVNKVFDDLLRIGTRMTILNFLNPFLAMFSNPSIWNRKQDDKNQEKNPDNRIIPHVEFKSQTKKNKEGKIEVRCFVYDVHRQFSRLKGIDGNKTKTDLIKDLENANIPFVSLVTANSYIKDATFDTIQDEKMKAIFMRRYFDDKQKTKSDVSQPASEGKDDAAPLSDNLFSSAIQGNITMLGNFVFETFAMIWLDFGVRQWNGAFFLYEIEDLIVPGEFTTTMKVYSAGTDPLKTKK